MKYFILIITLCLTLKLSAQSITKTSTSPLSGAVCPNSYTYYEVSVPSGFAVCQIEWSVTNGDKISQSGSTVTVQWNDTPGAMGRVTATFINCGNSNEGKSTYKEELILSVKNQSWGSYGNSVNLDYCTTNEVTLIMPRMFVQGTGGYCSATTY